MADHLQQAAAGMMVLLWTFTCSVRSLILLVSRAIWTSGEPVSFSLVRLASIIAVLSFSAALVSPQIKFDSNHSTWDG